jgi:hypothetical protein
LLESDVGEPASTLLFFGVLLLDYAVWFHLWPWLGARQARRRHPELPVDEERLASVALRGFVITLAALGGLVVMLWLVGAGRG